MPLLLNTSRTQGPFSLITHNTGDDIPEDDYSAKAEVAGVYHKGGRELLPNELVQQVDLDKKRTAAQLPPFFSGGDCLLVISPLIRDIIVSRQTKGIQTWPVMITYRNQSLCDESWFALNPWLSIPSIDLEKSRHEVSKGFGTVAVPRLILRHEQVGLLPDLPEDIHLWRDEQFPRSLLFSDELAEELKATKGIFKGAHTFQTDA